MGIIDNRPIYVQIADGLRDEILSGLHAAGERMPSVREVAASMQVNINTVMRAYELLERDGVIFNRRGMGYYMSPDAVNRIIEVRKHEFQTGEMEYFFTRLQQIGITPDELKQEYQDYLKR